VRTSQTRPIARASTACDALYDRSRQLPDSPERSQLYERMARQAEADTPWVLHGAVWRNVLAQKRVVGYTAHPFLLSDWMYADVLVESAGG
jgi:oligopeptide transport system substrate-binding protein